MQELHNTTRLPWVQDKNYPAFVGVIEPEYRYINNKDIDLYNQSLRVLKFTRTRSNSPFFQANNKACFEKKFAYTFKDVLECSSEKQDSPLKETPCLPLDFERNYSVKLYEKALSEGNLPPFPKDSACRLGHLLTHFQLQYPKDINPTASLRDANYALSQSIIGQILADEEPYDELTDITPYLLFDALVLEKPIDLSRAIELTNHFEMHLSKQDPDTGISYILLHANLSEEDKETFLSPYHIEKVLLTKEEMSSVDKASTWTDFFLRFFSYSR